MLQCPHCEKEFKTKRQLAGHQRVHGVSDGHYSKSRKRIKTIYNCLYCNTEMMYKSSTENKFCNIKCYNDYKWEHISKPKIENGKASAGSVKRYLKESQGEKCNVCGQLPIHNNMHLTLQLDHIDGDSDNNTVNNCQLLCPNCHTQTETFGNTGVVKQTKRNKYLRKYKA